MSAEKTRNKQEDPRESLAAESDRAGGDLPSLGEAPAEAHRQAASPGGEPTQSMDQQAEELAGELEQLRAELDETKDRALRSTAELENYRKRVRREMDDRSRYANMDLIRDLLPAWDNMGRAIEAAEQGGSPESLLQGFQMVWRQLESVLQRHHCKRIEALHQPFDPNLHEAISQVPSPEYPPGTVLQVTQVGFQLHDRVVRPCQVIVSSAPPEDAGRGEPAGGQPADDGATTGA